MIFEEKVSGQAIKYVIAPNRTIVKSPINPENNVLKSSCPLIMNLTSSEKKSISPINLFFVMQVVSRLNLEAQSMFSSSSPPY